MQQRPLGVLTECLQELGREISHAYDDLVFVSHNAYLLQFADEAARVKLFVNIATDEEHVIYEEISRLRNIAMGREIEITLGGYYSLEDAGEESVDVVFLQ